MVNTCIAEEYLNSFVHRLHPNLVNNIQSYNKTAVTFFQNIMGVITEIEMTQKNL